MSAPRLHLEIDAVWDGKDWRIVSQAGVMCQVLDAATIRRLRPNESIAPRRELRFVLKDHRWDKKCVSLSRTLQKRMTELGREPWDAKCASWSQTTKNNAKCASLRSGKAERVPHGDWNDRVRWMLKRCGESTRQSRRLSDEWTEWCENSRNNGSKRARRKAL